MGQDWRLAVGVAGVAAVAGWLAVRVIGGGAPTGTTPSEVAVTGPRQGDGGDGAPGAPAEAGPLDGTIPPPPPGGASGGSRRDRALLKLAAALDADHRIGRALFPVPGAASMPSILPYRRFYDFWQPAITAAMRNAR